MEDGLFCFEEMLNYPHRLILKEIREGFSRMDERLKKLEETVSSSTQGLQDLNASIANLQTQDAAVVTALNNLVTTQTSLQQQIAALQAQEGEVTDAQLEALAVSANAAQTAVATALAAIPVAPAPASPNAAKV